jgi:hypothetical protein
MPASVWLLNLIVFGVLMESDLGRRPIGWFRVLRPLITTAAIVPLFLTSLPTDGHNLVLQVAGAGVGVLLGLAAHLFISVSFDPARGRKRKTASHPASGRPVSRAGFGYAAFWTVIIGGRLLFIYGTLHWFSGAIGQFFAAHQLSANGLTNSLIFMALTMALTRSALLGIRGRAAARHAAAQHPAGAPGAVTATREAGAR